MVNKLIKFFANIVSPKKASNYRLSFNKESDDKWYIDYPSWKGPHHNLMMVAGADDLLEFLDSKQSYCREKCEPLKATVAINIHTSKSPLKYPENQIILKKIEGDSYGATYEVSNCPGFDKTVWICPVTLFVLGEYPEYIYIDKFYDE